LPSTRIPAAPEKVLQPCRKYTVLQALQRELIEGNTQSREAVISLLETLFLYETASGDRLTTAFKRSSDQFVRLLVELPSDEAARVRAGGLRLVADRCRRLHIPWSDVPGLMDRLRAGLQDTDYDMLAVATSAMVEAEPESGQLVASLIRLLDAPHYSQKLKAVHALAKLGPRAAPAVAKLTDVLDEAISEVVAPLAQSQRSAARLAIQKHPRGELIRETIVLLGNIGPAAEPSLKSLRAVSQYGFEQEVLDAIRRIGEPSN
jgi:hypothetical protein